MFNKDSFWLLFWGLVCSALAATFWYISGENGFTILASLLLISLIADNRRLRKKLSHYEQANERK